MKIFARVAFVITLNLMALNIAVSQPQAAITAEKIADNIYIVKGGMANTGFVVGEKEVAAIDAEMMPDQAQKMIEEIKKITPKPLAKLILTHSDGDHVNGLAGFPRGIEIISNATAKKEMEEAFKAPNSQALQPYLPSRTFTDKMDMEVAPERIQLLHFGPAHTSGDAVVFFPKQKVAFVGDLVFIGRDPLIHRIKGGSSTGLIKTLENLLRLDAERYVPGHGNIATKGDIEAEKKSLQEKQEKIKSLVKEGKSLDDVKKEFGIPITAAKPGGFSFPSLLEVMYLELSGK